MGYGAGIQPGYGAGRGVGYGAGAGVGYGSGTGSGYGAGVMASGTPITILGASLKGWWDASYLPSLWQDSARTTPVTADADPVGAIDDLSGNGKHMVQATAGSRPLYKTGIRNGLSCLLHDGTDDAMATASICQTTTIATLFCVVKTTANTGKFFLNGVGNGYGFNHHGLPRDFLCEGVANQDDGDMSHVAFEYWVGTVSAAPLFTLRVNGVGQTLTPNNSVVVTPSGNTSTGSTSNFMTGYLAEWGIANVVATDAQITALESYLTRKWGAP